MAAPKSSINAATLSQRVFNTMDPGNIEIGGLQLFQEFDIQPGMLTEGFDNKELNFPDFFKGVMQRYFFSYMAALHLADTYFIEEVSNPNADYEASKTKFLNMIQELPEELLKHFLERHDHALKNIPCDLSQEELYELGKKGFNIITKNGHDFYNSNILEYIDKAFERTKKTISQEIATFLQLEKNNPAHHQVSLALGEQIQSYVEGEESLQQAYIKAICDFLSGTYTLNDLPQEEQQGLEPRHSLFCPHYRQGGKKTAPVIYTAMLFEVFLPIANDLANNRFSEYIHSGAFNHLNYFRKHLDKANRLVFALDQLRIRYQNILNSTPA